MSAENKREMEIFNEFLNTKNLKLTTERRALVELMFKIHDHLNADEVLKLAVQSKLSVSRATVYRTLALLVESGLLREVRLPGKAVMYEHVFGHPHHDHLVCDHCGEIVEFLDEVIEQRQEELAQRFGFSLTTHSMVLYGLCKKCQ